MLIDLCHFQPNKLGLPVYIHCFRYTSTSSASIRMIFSCPLRKHHFHLCNQSNLVYFFSYHIGWSMANAWIIRPRCRLIMWYSKRNITSDLSSRLLGKRKSTSRSGQLAVSPLLRLPVRLVSRQSCPCTWAPVHRVIDICPGKCVRFHANHIINVLI